jgi:hypothetical protein
VIARLIRQQGSYCCRDRTAALYRSSKRKASHAGGTSSNDTAHAQQNKAEDNHSLAPKFVSG